MSDLPQLFPRLAKYNDLWCQPKVTFIVEDTIRKFIEKYLEPFNSNSNFNIVSLEDYAEQPWLIDDSIAAIVISSLGSDVTHISRNLILSPGCHRAHFLLVNNDQNFEKSSSTTEVYLYIQHFSSSEEFIIACRKFEKYIEPNVPCREEFLDDAPYFGPFEYQPQPESAIYAEWETVIENFRRCNFAEHYIMAGRLYGYETSGFRIYVLLYVSPRSRFETMDLTYLCRTFLPLVIITNVPMLQVQKLPETKIGQLGPACPEFSQIVHHGTSIGRCEAMESASFGGYVEIEGKVYGMSVCHGTCSSKCPSTKFNDDYGSPLESNSSLDRDYVITKANEDIKNFTAERDEIADTSTKAKDSYETYLKHAITTAQKNENLTSRQRYLGQVICCSGATVEGLDWSIFKMKNSRIGKNTFPEVNRYMTKYHEPVSLSLPRPITSSRHQWVVFMGRTSGYSRGYVRGLKVCELRNGGNSGHSFKRMYWSVPVLSCGGLRLPHGRAGDSGAWVFEIRSCDPVLMVVGGCAKGEVLCLSLDETFDDIKRVTGMDIKLPSYS